MSSSGFQPLAARDGDTQQFAELIAAMENLAVARKRATAAVEAIKRTRADGSEAPDEEESDEEESDEEESDEEEQDEPPEEQDDIEEIDFDLDLQPTRPGCTSCKSSRDSVPEVDSDRIDHKVFNRPDLFYKVVRRLLSDAPRR